MNKKSYSFELTCKNVEEVLPFVFVQGVTGAEQLGSSCATVYLESETAYELLQKELSDHFVCEIGELTVIDDQNWLALARADWRELHIGAFHVIPTDPESKIVPDVQGTVYPIYLQPGLGFGTGEHSTTKNVLLFLQHEELRAARPRTVLDVGTGSGILAIGACKLFGAEITAIDIDPDALSNARFNVALNIPAARVHLEETPISSIDNTFELVMANVYAEVLLEMKEELLRCTARDGFLILSGIMDTKAKDLKAAFLRGGLKLVLEVSEASWTTLLFQRVRE